MILFPEDFEGCISSKRINIKNMLYYKEQKDICYSTPSPTDVYQIKFMFATRKIYWEFTDKYSRDHALKKIKYLVQNKKDLGNAFIKALENINRTLTYINR